MEKMKVSAEALAAIKGFEGFRATPYKDAAGKWTVGYGHLLSKRPDFDLRLSESAATSLLEKDLGVAEAEVNRLCLGFTQGQFDALTDFVFNAGAGNFRASTLYKKLYAGRPAAEIAAEFERWVWCHLPDGKKKKLPGLVKRREWERDTFLS